MLLLPEPGDYLQVFLKALELRLPGLDAFDPTGWAVMSEPRPCSYGTISRGQWKWHVLIDPGGMPDEVQRAVEAGDYGQQVEAAFERQQVCVLCFLLEHPAEATSLDSVRALCEVAWAWLDVGAEVLVWPEGRTAALRHTLLGLNPGEIEAEHSYMFISNGTDRVERTRNRYWVRTWGMGQFRLPDLCAAVHVAGAIQESELESLRLLFETLPPAMISQQGVLPPGGTVTVGERVWTASPPPPEAPALVSRYGLQYFA